MNKTIITTAITSGLILGLIGFYGGRYYERKVFRQAADERRAAFDRGDFNPDDGGHVPGEGRFLMGR